MFNLELYLQLTAKLRSYDLVAILEFLSIPAHKQLLKDALESEKHVDAVMNLLEQLVNTNRSRILCEIVESVWPQNLLPNVVLASNFINHQLKIKQKDLLFNYMMTARALQNGSPTIAALPVELAEHILSFNLSIDMAVTTKKLGFAARFRKLKAA